MDSRSRISTVADNTNTETQALLATQNTRRQRDPASANQAAIYNPANQTVSSDFDESDIWDHFEVTRRSASYHLDEYLQFRSLARSESASGVPGSRDLVEQNDRPANRSFWRLKVARDNLLNELETLIDLLGIMSRGAKKGLAKFYVLLVLLITVLKFTESSPSTASTIAWWSSLIGLVPTTTYLTYKSIGWAAVSLCKPVLEQMHQKALDDTLEESDKDGLQSSKFKALWWMNYFYHR